MIYLFTDHLLLFDAKENNRIPQSVLSTIRKLKSGYINGTRVVLGRLEDFLSTSCIASLSFLNNTEEGDPDNLCHSVKEYLEKELQKPFIKTHNRSFKSKQGSVRTRRSGVAGLIKRTRSIQVDQYDPGTSFTSFNPLITNFLTIFTLRFFNSIVCVQAINFFVFVLLDPFFFLPNFFLDFSIICTFDLLILCSALPPYFLFWLLHVIVIAFPLLSPLWYGCTHTFRHTYTPVVVRLVVVELEHPMLRIDAITRRI